jgi:hypothetical protein
MFIRTLVINWKHSNKWVKKVFALNDEKIYFFFKFGFTFAGKKTVKIIYPPTLADVIIPEHYGTSFEVLLYLHKSGCSDYLLAESLYSFDKKKFNVLIKEHYSIRTKYNSVVVTDHLGDTLFSSFYHEGEYSFLSSIKNIKDDPSAVSETRSMLILESISKKLLQYGMDSKDFNIRLVKKEKCYEAILKNSTSDSVMLIRNITTKDDSVLMGINTGFVL